MPTISTTSIEHARAEVDTWAVELQNLAEHIYPRFRRVEARQRFLLYLKALLAPIERKNAWQLAEQAGDPTPCRMQHLLRSAIWDSDQVRDDLRDYVVEHLGEPDGVLVVDETGFLKQGTKSVGVQRQYSGTAGRTENCQVGVFLTYASSKGHTFLDRELYLPKSWTEAPERCRAAGVPEDTEFATKLQLARRMVERAVQAKVPARWVSADALYGADHRLRRFVEEQGLGYVLAVPSNQSIWVGRCQRRIDGLVAERPEGDWQRLSCGQGSKGPRLYDWLAVPYEHPDGESNCRWVLARRNLSEPTDIAYFLASGPADTALAQLVQVVGKRWTIETCFATAKGEVGLDHYEVRCWKSWYRHITLSLLAHAFLTVLQAKAVRVKKPPRSTAGSLFEFKVRLGLYYQ